MLAACTGNRRITRPIAKKVLSDSSARIYSLEEQSDKEVVYYVTPSGKKILMRKVKDFHPPARAPRPDTMAAIMADAAPGTVAHKAGPNDPFTGKIRVAPKTSYSKKPKETFPTIAVLYRKLKSPDYMNNLHIGNKEERVNEEDRDIVISKAYLYTITIETDNDLHLLIGNTPSYIQGTTRMFNAEISAIPPDAPADVKEHMRQLRSQAIRETGAIPLCGRVGYLQSNHRIRLRGTLFYDTHHTGSPARCDEVEGESAWEIHPVWEISFEQ